MVIDTENLGEMTLPELGLLLMLYDRRVDKSRTVVQVKDTDIRQVLAELQKKGYVMASVYATDQNHRPPLQHVAWSLLEKGKLALAEACVQEKPVLKRAASKAIKDRCDALAPKLMELYPMGKKPGTNNQWRGYKGGVSEKLQKLLVGGETFTDEEAIEATRAYVDGFNGMYTNMRVLPYFLGKNEVVGGEVKKTCDFMSYVEDIRNNPQQVGISNNWDVALR
ncbi:MAG: hypothetical protein J6M44_02480 [Butyrivibrio sp.]|nr:hypothetical protein [Butyrivibrio sp.]